MDEKTIKRLKAKLLKAMKDNPDEFYRAWRFGMTKQADVSLPGRASCMMATGQAESTVAGDVYPPHVGVPGPVVRRVGAHLVDLERVWKPKKKPKSEPDDRGPGFPDVPIHPWATLSRRFPGVF